MNLRAFRDRNFAVGSALVFLFGITLYSVVTVLPLFYQELLGYTACAAGLAGFPRGVGSILGMPVIGFLSNRVDGRWLLTFGFLVYGIVSLIFGDVTLAVGPFTLLWPTVVTGFALSFVFVPITNVSYGTLPQEEIGNSSGLFNLLRNVGGSVGISTAQTLLTRRSDHHQNEILNYVPQSGAAFQQRLGDITGYLAHQTNPANAGGAAQGQIYTQLGSQALLWAFVDVFRWLAVLCFISMAGVWGFKKVKGKAPQGAH